MGHAEGSRQAPVVPPVPACLLTDCAYGAWPGGAGIGVIYEDGPSLHNATVAVSRTRFLRGTARCDTPPKKDFFTACAGGLGAFMYDDTLTNFTFVSTDNVFIDNVAEYGT